MRCKFPYFEDRPHIPIILKNGSIHARFLPLLDSGADFSVFYKADAARLDLDLQLGERIELLNPDGSSFHARRFLLNCQIEEFEFKAKICFMDIFRRFAITLKENEKYVDCKNL